MGFGYGSDVVRTIDNKILNELATGNQKAQSKLMLEKYIVVCHIPV